MRTRPRYLQHPNGFTAVLTPHFIDTWDRRVNGANISMIEWVGKVAEVWDDLSESRTYGGEIRTNRLLAYAYFARRFNAQRMRWELEMIDVAPARHFNTRGRSSSGHRHGDTAFVEVNT